MQCVSSLALDHSQNQIRNFKTHLSAGPSNQTESLAFHCFFSVLLSWQGKKVHENLNPVSCVLHAASCAAPVLRVPLMTASFVCLVPHLFQSLHLHNQVCCCCHHNEAVCQHQVVCGGTQRQLPLQRCPLHPSRLLPQVATSC